jgi:hypothetical protein
VSKSNAQRQADWRERHKQAKAESTRLKKRLALAERMLDEAMAKLARKKS